jgi:hypothetical protein
LLHLSGHIVGPDRKSGASPVGHGSDETVAIALLLRIAAELIEASNDLFMNGKAYAAAALIRQMVEVEYLAWAFETRKIGICLTQVNATSCGFPSLRLQSSPDN